MNALRIVFAGSPRAAIPSLRALAGGRHRVVSVVTREDSARGRHRIQTPTAVAEAAAELGLPVLKANRVGSLTDPISALAPDLGVIVAYSGLIREPLLSLPRLGWINLHFSLLPRWRGAAPVQHALIAGDDITGATVFRLMPELDAGPVYGRLTQAIGPTETAGDLLHSLAQAGAGLLAQVVDALATGDARADPQRGDSTLAPKLSLADGLVDWRAPAAAVLGRIRGVTPEPGAFTLLAGDRLRVLAAAPAPGIRLPAGRFARDGKRVLVGTADEAVELLKVQPAGRNPMPAADWWRGRRGDAALTADAPGTPE